MTTDKRKQQWVKGSKNYREKIKIRTVKLEKLIQLIKELVIEIERN